MKSVTYITMIVALLKELQNHIDKYASEIEGD